MAIPSTGSERYIMQIKRRQLTRGLLRETLATGSRFAAACARPCSTQSFVVTAERTRLFGAPFAGIPRKTVTSTVTRGAPLRVGDYSHHILPSFRDRFLALLARCGEVPDACEEAFVVTVESREGIECFYSAETDELTAVALRRLPDDLVVQNSGTTRDARDTGRKVGSAAKDRAALRADRLSREELRALEESGDREARAGTDKDAVLPRPSLDALREGGVPPGVAYLFTVLRRAVARRPPLDAAARAAFVVDLPELFERILACPSVGVVREILETLCGSPLEVYGAYVFGPRFWNLMPFQPRAFTGRSPWNRAVHVEASSAEEDAWALARAYLTAPRTTAQSRNETKPLPVRQKLALEDLRREGPPVTISTPEDLLDRFGLTGVEFGNWVARAEGRCLLSHVAGALHDLGDVLDFDLPRLARSGNLALALGARGRGKYCAHYEPSKRVINLTKKAGDGSLAHEIAHFLDHMLGLRYGKLAGFLTEEHGKLGRSQQADRAVADVIETIESREIEEEVSSTTARQWYDPRWVARWAREVGGEPQVVCDHIAATFAKRFRYGRRAREDSVSLVRSVAVWFGRPLSLKIRYCIPTDYLRNAKRLGRYWVKRPELFARAFESFVDDALTDRSRLNEYLVAGTRSDFSEFRGNPYPLGEERARIHDALRRFLTAVRAL